MIEKVCHKCKTKFGQKYIEIEITEWNGDSGNSHVYYFHKKCYGYVL